MAINHWMSWEGGVDLVALTRTGLTMPNVIVHVARVVHTPAGSAPSGMILWQPDPGQAPSVMGFISTNPEVGGFFGPNIFAGTPFEHAPVLQAKIEVTNDRDGARSRIEVGGTLFETRLSKLSSPELIHRPPQAMPPFWQQGMELTANVVELRVNGDLVTLIIPPVGISGGPAAVFSPCGLYAR